MSYVISPDMQVPWNWWKLQSMEVVPQQDVKELDTLKEQDILAIIGMCYETNFILSICDVFTQWVFLIAVHKKTDPSWEKI